MDALNSPPQPRLTRAEYWLLETVVDCFVPLHFLEAEGYSEKSSIEHMFNKRGHGLDRHQLTDCLDGLFSAGLIEAWASDDEPTFAPTREQLIAALCIRPTLEERVAARGGGRRLDHDFSYRLTPKGGATWEAFAAPEWEKYLYEELNPQAHAGTLICMTHWRIQTYLEYLSMNLFDCSVAADTVQIVECGQWQATYWKCLPQGFHASFACNETEGRTFPTRNAMEHAASSGACEFRDGWYRWR